MPVQVVQKRCRGPICVNAHPEGCRRLIEQQIDRLRAGSRGRTQLRSVLIVGCSAGYGLAARLVATWRYGARTVGLMLERAPEGRRTATAGYYNTVAMHEFARRDGFEVVTFNLDAFSDAARTAAIAALAGAPAEVFIYSLAAPRRLHPRTGRVHHSVLKPVGAPFSERTVELDTGRVIPVTLEPATEEEIADTVAVMGGEDWRFWVEALLEAGALAPGAQTIALSYIGPRLTWPIYRDGTIGRAKAHLEQTAQELNRLMAERIGGSARVSVQRAVVTQASAAIPVVPLYLSLLLRVSREKGIYEGPLEQMLRLFDDWLVEPHEELLDSEGRIRLDDGELRPDVQEEIERRWLRVTTESLSELADFGEFMRLFHQVFGFDVPGVDYGRPVETALLLEW
jgi:enoyl-[acyl-carrier protein] reductase/trans-2-enoyl-CoA reductase (NAD+)